MDAKSGERGIDMLQAKHPDVQVPEASELEDYKILPDFID
jgi:hypothetical protein